MNDRVETAKAKVQRAKEELSRVRKQAVKETRRTRDTAIYTIGGCFAALLESREGEETALMIWEAHLAPLAPRITNDRRRVALEDAFGLKPTPSG